MGLDEPLGYPDGLNAYTVELNSPVGKVDPMGLAVTGKLSRGPFLMGNQKPDYRFDVLIGGLENGKKYVQVNRITSTLTMKDGSKESKNNIILDYVVAAGADSTAPPDDVAPTGVPVKPSEWADRQTVSASDDVVNWTYRRTLEIYEVKELAPTGNEFWGGVEMGDGQTLRGDVPGQLGTGGAKVIGPKLFGYSYEYRFLCTTDPKHIIERLMFTGLSNATNVLYRDGTVEPGNPSTRPSV
jgi:hypothetical protein